MSEAIKVEVKEERMAIPTITCPCGRRYVGRVLKDKIGQEDVCDGCGQRMLLVAEIGPTMKDRIRDRRLSLKEFERAKGDIESGQAVRRFS